MKKILFLFVFLIKLFEGKSNVVVDGKIIGYDHQNAFINLPINGFSNYSLKILDYRIEIDSNQQFKKKFYLSDPLFITIHIGDENIWLLLEPEDSVSLIIDLREPRESNNRLSIRGNNSAGHMYYHRFNLDPARKYNEIWRYFNSYKIDDPNTSKILKAIVDSSCLGFDSLYKNRLIDKSYYNIVVTSVKATMASEILKKYLRPSKFMTNVSFKTLDSLRTMVFNMVNHDDTAIYKGLISELFLQDYYNNYYLHKNKLCNINQISDMVLITPQKDTLKIKQFLTPFIDIKDLRLREEIWGMSLCFTYTFAPYAIDGGDLKSFKYYYPGSPYVKYLEFNMNNLTKSEKKDSTGLSKNNVTNIVLLDSSNNSKSFAELIKRNFNGENVFVDIWATWCQPCMAEFFYNRPLDSFLITNNIKRLNISFDQLSSKDAVVNIISKTNLYGVNIIASGFLQDNMIEVVFQNRTTYTIPRYLIVNKQGKIVELNANMPSSGQLLFHQLKTLLLL